MKRIFKKKILQSFYLSPVYERGIAMKDRAVPTRRRLRVPHPFSKSGLRRRMTVSYMTVTLGLENLGLVGALRKLAQAYSTRLGITVTADVKPVALDVKTEHALLRIAQEALANAARHSSATLISLCLASEENRVKRHLYLCRCTTGGCR
jgi:hypothetical protein